MADYKPKSEESQPRRPEVFSATPTADELSRAEAGDPWAVLLVGLLRAGPSNHGFHLTAALVDSAAPHVDLAQPQVNPDR